MSVLFWILFGSDLSKMDQTWSNWISHQSKNVIIKSCHIYRKDKNGCFILDFLDRSVKNGSNWVKLYQYRFFTNQKLLCTIKSCHICHENKNCNSNLDQIGSNLSKMDQICPKWIKSVQNGSNLSKMDQTGLNWIFHRPKMNL
jgi:hypothetical protein